MAFNENDKKGAGRRWIAFYYKKFLMCRYAKEKKRNFSQQEENDCRHFPSTPTIQLRSKPQEICNGEFLLKILSVK